ncbi:UdgX family uracil-DNA binding protein [Aquabacterium sp. A7-Y]|uniref:UdgX family uracil-DNA binding protein n=1 Tax=Aquabacterium sp. A7-Y TaxID=1349605 RepID=UPI00223D1D01|nr:UdgX family uracil-DNA binding protein [Aquabacterium sp. A7-Y]MCW7538470.1 UdgX family uracil-DNA binding protein [Aquabacterium sp. A7-Y]
MPRHPSPQPTPRAVPQPVPDDRANAVLPRAEAEDGPEPAGNVVGPPPQPPRVRLLGRSASALRALAEQAAGCRECPLGFIGTQTVWGEGRGPARLMLVGEQPGDQEDQAGRPFVGPAGRLLDRALEELGWDREQLYITNAVKHFKYEMRGKRRLHKTPAQKEVAACHHWLESEIERVRPEGLVALGATAARSLLARAVPVMAERGHWMPRADGRPVLITLHPSALLRLRPPEREAAYGLWLEDLRLAAQLMG